MSISGLVFGSGLYMPGLWFGGGPGVGALQPRGVAQLTGPGQSSVIRSHRMVIVAVPPSSQIAAIYPGGPTEETARFWWYAQSRWMGSDESLMFLKA